MSSSAVQALISLGGSAPSQGVTTGASGSDQDLASGQQFAQLLSDSGAQTEGETPQQFVATGATKVTAVGSVVAQEVADALPHALENLMQKHDEPLTAENAELLVARIEQLLRGKADNAQHAALGKIKEQLQTIVRGGEPKTLGEIVQAVASPSTKENKVSLVALFAMLVNKKSHNAQKTEEAPTSLAASTQAIPAGIFRPLDGEVAPAPAATLEEAQKGQLEITDSVTIVTPLAATNLVATQLQTEDASITASQTIRDLDAVIAPLKLQAGGDSLPEVELPKIGGEAQAKALPTSALTPSLLASAGALAKDGAKTNEAGVVISDKSLASFENLLNPSHSNGLSPTQTLRAPQPVQLPYGLINHAPVTEQVKVAIQQANKEGVEQITIQLDPVDLGRVEVSMRTNREGITHISFMVDKADTFDGLSRDARFLERSLQEAGIKSDTGSMQFNLRQQPQPQLHSDLGGNRQQRANAENSDDDTAVSAITPSINFTKNYTLNIREGVDISA
jgi:flagellar hook-length control protein FliK